MGHLSVAPYFAALALAISLLLAPAASASHGDFHAGVRDTSYGVEGRAERSPVGSPTGGIVVDGAGRAVLSARDGTDWLLAPFSADGTPEASTAITVPGAQGAPRVTAADGGFVQAGATSSGWAVVRRDAGGQQDTAFGGDGIVETSFTGVSGVRVAAVLEQGLGRIVVVGDGATSGGRRVLVQGYAADGTPDTAYRSIVPGPGDPVVTGAAVDGLGRLVIAGNRGVPDQDAERYFVMRLTSGGAVDGSFDGDGLVEGDFVYPASTFYQAYYTTGRMYDVTTDAENRPVLAGTIARPDGSVTQERFFAVRRTDAGAPDTSFSADGQAIVGFGVNSTASTDGAYSGADRAAAESVLVQNDGKILLGGWVDNLSWSDPRSARARLTAAGRLENGTAGTTSFADTRVGGRGVGGPGHGRALALEAGGKILLGGDDAGASSVWVERYLNDLDTSAAPPPPTATARVVDGVLTFVAYPGEREALRVSLENGQAVVSDPAIDITAQGSDCVNDTPNKVRCQGVSSVLAYLDDGDDSFTADASAGTLPLTVEAGDGADVVTGGDGPDRLFGQVGTDTLDGGAGADEADGGPEADTVDGGTGDDDLRGGDGDDVVRGQAGGDDLAGDVHCGDEEICTPGDDRLEGGDGGDDLRGDEGDDRLDGGDETDDLTGSEGDDTLAGGPGGDFLNSDPGADSITGGAGSDLLIYRGAAEGAYVRAGVPSGSGCAPAGGGTCENDTVAADWEEFRGSAHGDDVVVPAARADGLLAFHHGGEGDDRITGSSGPDRIFGDAGDDALSGAGGEDDLRGGSESGDAYADGDDVLSGGDGRDRLVGENGADDLDGGTGGDALYPEHMLAGVAGTVDADDVRGGADVDEVFMRGGTADRSLSLDGVANDGNTDAGESDNVHADVENASLGAGNDTLLLSDAANSIDAGAGDDVVEGRGGDDALYGGEGDDELTGGPGADDLQGVEGVDELQARDGAADRRIDCGTGAGELAVVDASEAVTACEDVRRPAGTEPEPEPTPEPTPGPEATPTPTPAGDQTPASTPTAGPGTTPPGPIAERTAIPCPSGIELYLRGDVPLSAGGWPLDVDAPIEDTAIAGELIAADGTVVARAERTVSRGGLQDLPLRFALQPEGRASLSGASSTLTLRLTADLPNCGSVTATDQVTVVRDKANGRRMLRTDGRMSLRPTARASREVTLVDLCIAQPPQPNWDAMCAGVFGGGGGTDPAPGCEGQVPFPGGITITGSCFKKDKNGVYVTKANFRLNGIDIAPSGGGTISFNPETWVIRASGNVRVVVAGATVYNGGFNQKIFPGKELSFGDGRIRAGATLKGFKMSGSLSYKLKLGGATAKVALELPTPKPAKKSKPGKLTAAADLEFDAQRGLVLEGLDIKVPEFVVGQLEVKPFTISYAGKTDTWAGKGTIVVPSPRPKPAVATSFKFTKGRLVEAHLEFDNINKPLPFGGGAVFLQKLGGGFQWESKLVLDGTLGLSAGPRVKGLPQLVYIESTAKYTFDDPGVWEISGDLKALDQPLSKGHVVYTTDGKLSFDGSLSKTFGEGSTSFDAEASIKGSFAPPNRVTAEGKGAIGLGALKLGGTVTADNTKLVGCLDGIDGAGGTYILATKQVRLFEGCGNGALAKAKVEAADRAKGKPKAKGSQAGGPPTEFGVPSGVPHEVFAVTGAGGLPQGTLVGPTGVRLPTPAPGEATRTKDGMALSDADASTVYFTVEDPAAGVWVFEPAPGSPAIALAQQADGQKAADVDGKVTGKGQRRTLDYRLTVQPGQKVRFVEEGPDAFQELGSARSGKHELSFAPAPGSPGRRTIRAIVEQDGYPARSLTVATYRASVDDSPGAVGSLKASRRGDEVRARWGKADDADAYHVTVRLSDGRTESYEIPGGRRSLVVERVDRDVSASVTVQGVSFAGRAGPARSTRVKAGREKRERRAPRARRAPDELGSAVVLYAVR